MKRTVVFIQFVVIGSILALPSCGKHTPTSSARPTGQEVPLPPAPPPAPPGPTGNQPPALHVKITPDPTEGPAPLAMHVNMCTTTDPENDPLTYTFKFGSGSRDDLTPFCRGDYVYDKPGRFKPYFCVTDGKHPRVCFNTLVDVR